MCLQTTNEAKQVKWEVLEKDISLPGGDIIMRHLYWSTVQVSICRYASLILLCWACWQIQDSGRRLQFLSSQGMLQWGCILFKLLPPVTCSWSIHGCTLKKKKNIRNITSKTAASSLVSQGEDAPTKHVRASITNCNARLGKWLFSRWKDKKVSTLFEDFCAASDLLRGISPLFRHMLGSSLLACMYLSGIIHLQRLSHLFFLLFRSFCKTLQFMPWRNIYK